MKRKQLFMAGILALSVSISAASWAGEAAQELPVRAADESSEESGLLGFLFGSDGVITGLLPDEAEIEALRETVDEQVGSIESQTREAIEEAKEVLESKYGSVDLEAILEGYGGELISSLFGGDDDFDFASLDAIAERYDNLRKQMADRVREMNAESLIQGDAQIVSITIANDPDYDADEFKYLVAADQADFEADGTSLRFAGSASFPVLFTFRKAEDGSDTITDVKVPEDGEGFADSLREMCAEADYPFEEMLREIDLGKIFILEEMSTYLKDHPEYELIEVDGEMKTAQEVDDLFMDRFIAYGEEGETEQIPPMEETESVTP